MTVNKKYFILFSQRLPVKAFLKNSTLRSSSNKLTKTESVDSGSADNILTRVVLKPVLNSELNKTNRGGEKFAKEGEENRRNSVSDRNSIIELSKNLDQLIQCQVNELPEESKFLSTDINRTTQLSPRHIHNNSVKLCDKVLSFRKNCLNYAEDSLSPQQRFRFRELLTKLEKNAELLRSTNCGPNGLISESKHLSNVYQDLQTNIKDIVLIVQK